MLENINGDNLPDVHYQGDALAELIVDLWVSDVLRDAVVNIPTGNPAIPAAAAVNPGAGVANAKSELAGRGLHFANAVVVSHEFVRTGNNYRQGTDDEITFVLPPRPADAELKPREQLLETARILMAVFPHGI